MLRLQVFGPIELHDNSGRELRAILAQPKRLALLVYLASGAQPFHRRDTLLGLFWPEHDDARGRGALNQALGFLRKELVVPSVILSRGNEEVGVDFTKLWCDAHTFRDGVAATQPEVLELYLDDFLRGFFLSGAPAFEEWVERERANLRSMAAKAAHVVAEAREREERFTTAVSNARRAVELSDLDERAMRELLALLDRLGDRAGALHAYDDFARRLSAEYGSEPAAESKALAERIRARTDSQTLTNLGGWRIIREIGRGGMATVYLAQDTKHDRRVALKLMHPQLALSIGVERFLREIQIMGRLAHPHILPLIDSGTADGIPYLVTPYIAGETLARRLRCDGTLPLDDAVRIAREVAAALNHAHRHGVVHCDVKPSNILLQDGEALIADFGVARAFQSAGLEGVTSALVLGTPSYMSPEQANGSNTVDARSDVYSLGVVLHEMLTGELPDSRRTSTARAGLPAQVNAALDTALSIAPSDRFSSVAAFARALTEPVVFQPVSPSRRRIHRGWTKYAVAIAGSLMSVWVGAEVLGAMGIGPSASLLSSGRLKRREPLLVTQFRVAGVDSSIAEAVAYATRVALGESREVRVVPTAVVDEALRLIQRPPRSTIDLALARDIAAREGFRAIVDGHVVRAGEQYDVGLRLVAANAGTDLAAFHEPAADLDAVIPTLDALTRRLREEIGESVKSVRASPPLAHLTTPSMEALRLFSESTRLNADFHTTLLLAQRAVEVDTQFAIAWSHLAALYSELGIRQFARDSAVEKAYKLRFRATQAERLRIEADHYSLLGDRERAVVAREEIVALGDSAPDILTELGEAYQQRREFAKAERFQRAALAIRRGSVASDYEKLAETLLEQGKLDASDSLLDAGTKRLGNVWTLHKARLQHLFHRGLLAEYEHALDSLRALREPTLRRQATDMLGDLMLLEGRLTKWAQLRDEDNGPHHAATARVLDGTRSDIALTELWIRRDTARAIREYQVLLAERPPTQPQRLQSAQFFATAERADLARSALSQYERITDSASRRRFAYLAHRARGAIANTERHTAESLDEVRRGDIASDGPVDQCAICLEASLGAVFDRAGLVDSAIVRYERYVDTPNSSHIIEDRFRRASILARLGELHASRGNRQKAIQYYAQFIDLWKHADPELQPRVAEARRRMEKLNGAL